ncbi:MAG: extracellular solute-binding protein [Chloroflexi bacterium]|nr:extracellular solute-binding protein [Chloroflexota bacterium]
MQTGSAPPIPEPTPTFPTDLSGALTIWTFAQGDDEVAIKAYMRAFKDRFPDVEPKLVVIPEDSYTAKINTSLQARNPPDIAIIEDMRWAKAGRVVELSPHLAEWGVDIADFNPGGIGRMALEADPAKGVYGMGDFLGGFVLVYNRKLFAEAALAYPPTDRSLTFREYDTICRALVKPGSDPAQTVYGCAAHDNAYGMVGQRVFGADGRTIVGNGDSPEMVDAFNVGTALIRDKVAPSGSVMDAIGGETDLFALGKIGITGTDFTEVAKYQANGIDFGIAPFYVIRAGDSVVDTFTAPWGTFTESRNQRAALEFIRFLATDAQRIRMTISLDPPLSAKVASETGYGKDDPIRQQYLEVLKLAQPQVFVPNGVEAWDPGEVVRRMTVERETDAAPILGPMVAKAQRELDSVWTAWEELGP